MCLDYWLSILPKFHFKSRMPVDNFPLAFFRVLYCPRASLTHLFFFFVALKTQGNWASRVGAPVATPVAVAAAAAPAAAAPAANGGASKKQQKKQQKKQTDAPSESSTPAVVPAELEKKIEQKLVHMQHEMEELKNLKDALNKIQSGEQYQQLVGEQQKLQSRKEELTKELAQTEEHLRGVAQKLKKMEAEKSDLMRKISEQGKKL
jgi:beta-glucosidase/6-phospho-beta-glucosidase/beta-galactosidase